MKRLVNAYGVERDLRFLAGRLDDGTSPGQLALWGILQLRRPLLAEQPAARVGGSRNGANGLSDEISELARTAPVRNVIEGRGVGYVLTEDALRRIVS
jgi:hypothetical protein